MKRRLTIACLLLAIVLALLAAFCFRINDYTNLTVYELRLPWVTLALYRPSTNGPVVLHIEK